jgi:hypothetical protein
MVRHATQKKRRSGVKVSRRLKRNPKDKIAKKANHPLIKKFYDKSKSPKENLESLGLESDANNLLCSKANEPIDKKYKAFQGFSELITQAVENQPKKKEKLLDEFQLQYAYDCLKRYQNNYEKMQRDIKLNYNQMTAVKLEKLCIRYLLQTGKSLEDFSP